MKKISIVFMALLVSTGAFAQDAEGNNQEPSKFSLIAKGEIDASFKNYTGNRFMTEKGVYDESSVTTRVPGISFEAEYKITSKWIVNSEAEYISGAGVQLDKFSITHAVNPAFNVTAGLLPLPIGHCNSEYGYIDYFHTGDPEGEYALIPCPMTETGVALSGKFNCGLSYHASITTGMDAKMFNTMGWTVFAPQAFNFSESNFDSPAYTFRLGYEGLTNFKMSAGVYYCANTAENMTLKKDYKEFCTNNYNGQKKVPLTIWYAEAQYMNDYVTLRGTYLQGNMGNSGYLSNYFNYLLQNDTDEELQYDEGVVGRGVVSVMGEVGLNLKNCFYADTKGPELYPFVHYEHYDSQAKAADMAGVVRDPRGKVDMWSFGVNWKPINEVAVKCNYTTRKIGDGDMNSANELNLAVAYNFQLF